MRLTIYQPQYFPRLHYFNRILDSDIFVILDSAQYTKSMVHEGEKRERHKTFQADALIKNPQGKMWLTVPISHAGLQSINETKISYGHPWPKKHLNLIRAGYAKAPHFKQREGEVETLLNIRYETLAALTTATILWSLARLTGLTTSISELTVETVNQHLEDSRRVRLKKIIRDSEMQVTRPAGRQMGTEWTAAICKNLGVTEYYYGGTAQAGYMDLDYYRARGITPVLQDWKLEEYPQQFPEQGFIPNLSILDLLLNVDSREALQLLTSPASGTQMLPQMARQSSRRAA